MTRIVYTSDMEVKRAADIPSGVDSDADVLRAMEEGAAAVEEQLHRYFYPELTTHTFQWPQSANQPSNLLYLGKHGILTKTGMTLTNGDGSVVDSSRYSLAPKRYGPPFTKVELDGAFISNSVFPDSSITIAASFGYQLNEQVIGTTQNQLSGTSVIVSDASKIGVGSLLRIGAERLVVTAKGGWVDSGNLVAITLANRAAADTFAVTDGSDFRVNEDILIGSEVMRVQRIVGNNLIVRRAVDGSALQDHTAVTAVYVDRRLTVERAVLGSTATDTNAGADVLWFRYPPLVEQLNRAEALTVLGFDIASYAVSSGSDDAKIKHSTKPLEDLRKRCFEAHGRLRVG